MRKLAALSTACAALLAGSVAHAETGITDKLVRRGSAVRVTSKPAGTTSIQVAVMEDLAGDGLKYLTLPASQRVYTPPAATPVVDVRAHGPEGPIGGWAGRLQTVPRPERPPKTEPPLEAPPVEEPPLEEPPLEEPPSMVVGVDSGGWGGSAFSDLASGGIHYIRTSSAHAGLVAEAIKAGVQVASVIFGEGGTIGAINPASYGLEVAAYFNKYGRAGGLAVEVLNEPGGSWFWSDPTNYTAYTKLAKATHEALATLPAEKRPVELCTWDGGVGGGTTFGKGIEAAGALPYCDGVTVHPYGGSSGQHGGAQGDRKVVEGAHGESGLPVYVTEVGWPTAVGQPPTGDSQQWTEAQQAANITGLMAWAHGTGYVPMVIYFNYVDYGTNAFYGIEAKSRVHKLSFAALAQAAARYG